MQHIYIGYHRDRQTRQQSSSGGVFSALSDAFLLRHQDGTVYGCILDEELVARHVRAQTKQERDRMRGSKYTGSRIGDAYQQAKADMDAGKAVLFSGTPCQIGGLRSFLTLSHTPMNALLTVEVLCHGVASQRFFRDYIAYLEKQYASKAVRCNFRTKRYAGKKQDMEITFANGKQYYAASTRYDWFYAAYQQNYVLRPACYRCPYTTQQRKADVTIGDVWSHADKEVARSLILTNTVAGEKAFEDCAGAMQIEEVPALAPCPSAMVRPAKPPQKMEAFWRVYLAQGYVAAQKFIGNATLLNKVKVRLISLANYTNLLPRIKSIIRKLKASR